MPFATTIKYDVKIEKGPPPESVESKFDVDAYLPVTMTIPVKPAGRQVNGKWDDTPMSTEIILDAGDRAHVKFVMISASEYADPNCTKTPIALLLQFDGKDGDWNEAADAEVIWLQGPLLFSGYTLAMLPSSLGRLYVQNHRGKDIELKILIGKSFMKPSMKPVVIGVEEKAAQRGGIRAAQMASR